MPHLRIREDTWLYIIAEDNYDELTDLVKVGISGNPWYRVEALQPGCPSGCLFLYHAFCFPFRRMALELEQGFHRWQKGQRLHGEWFHLMPHDALDKLRTHIAASFREFDEDGYERLLDVLHGESEDNTTDLRGVFINV
jgi:hypothetical protein